MQEHSEYNFVTNSVKFMQRTSTSLSVSEGDSSVCN